MSNMKPVLYEVDQQGESTGAEHPFCSDGCRNDFVAEGKADSMRMAESSLNHFAEAPECEECGKKIEVSGERGVVEEIISDDPDAGERADAQEAKLNAAMDADGPNGHCDTCGAPSDEGGCTKDRTHQIAVERTGPVDVPWQVDECNTANGVTLQVVHLWEADEGAGGITTHTDEVCEVCMDYRGTRSLDTANLLSAAPELFSVCKQLIAWSEGSIDERVGWESEKDVFGEIENAARAAIAKAQGAI